MEDRQQPASGRLTESLGRPKAWVCGVLEQEEAREVMYTPLGAY